MDDKCLHYSPYNRKKSKRWELLKCWMSGGGESGNTIIIIMESKYFVGADFMGFTRREGVFVILLNFWGFDDGFHR